MSRTIVVLEGDQTGQELLEEALRVLDESVIGYALEFLRFDLSLENRRLTQNEVVYEAGRALREYHVGLKAATITPEEKGDVGSPNRILREEMDAEIILRTGRRIPGVRPAGGVYSPISIVRMARGGAYGAKEWREGEEGSLNEVTYRTERISRRLCHDVAEFAFQQAKRTNAKVFGGPKFTVSPVYEGMLKEEMDKAAARHPGIRYEPQLIDATFALLLTSAGDAMVIPSLNRDGDLLSDMVLQMFGSIAGSESMVISVDDQGEHVDCVMAEAPHGTAPALEGRNVANPMGMILAAAGLLSFMKEEKLKLASCAIYESTLEAVNDGFRTSDLGGAAQTDEFTDEIIRRVRSKLDIWSTLV